MTYENMARYYNETNARTDDDKRKAALAWLDEEQRKYAGCLPGSLGYADGLQIGVIKEMLTEPRLPQLPPPAVLAALRDKLRNHAPEVDVAQAAYECYYAVYKALQPTVLVWCVSYTHADGIHKGSMHCTDYEGALAHARTLVRDGVKELTIEQVEVPA